MRHKHDWQKVYLKYIESIDLIAASAAGIPYKGIFGATLVREACKCGKTFDYVKAGRVKLDD